MLLDLSYHELTSLTHYNFPVGVTELNVSCNRLTSLEGCPSTVTKLHCSRNKLKSLKGCPPSVTHLWAEENVLTTLEGCSPIISYLNVANNRLSSLESCPLSVEVLVCYANSIPTCAPLQNSKCKRIDCDNNPLVDFLGPAAVDLSKVRVSKPPVPRVKRILLSIL